MADEEKQIEQEIKEEVVEETPATEPEVHEEVPETQEVTDQPTEEVSEEPIVEESKEKVEEPSDNPEDVSETDTEVPEVDKPEEESPEVEEVSEDEVPTEPEKSEREIELENKLAEYEAQRAEAESLARLDEVDRAIAQHIKQTEDAVIKSMEDMAKKYGIPTDVTMEELEKQDPTKAAIAKEIAQNAQRVMMQKQQEMEQAREVEAAKVVFAKAEKLFDKHNLTQEQAEVAADTFIAIIKETGVQDLGQDLIEKVELSVAKALMKVPVVMEIHDKIEEVRAKEEVKEEADTTVLETPTEKIEEVVEEKTEKKADVPPPDLSEFMEGATSTSSVENPDAVTSENVLQKLAALPFKQRTKFLAENMDAYNEAMRRARR